MIQNLKYLMLFMAMLTSQISQAQSNAPVALTPQEMIWKESGGLSLPGLKQAIIFGDTSKKGMYVVRLEFPAGYVLRGHSHPDSRTVTVLEGDWLTGYGDKFDESKLKSLPAGSVYTEPANLPHFVMTKVRTVIQVQGFGPSGRNFTEDELHEHK